MGLGKSLGQRHDVFDGQIPVHDRICIVDRRHERFLEFGGLRKYKADNVLIRLKTEGPEQYEHGNGTTYHGHRYTDLACLENENGHTPSLFRLGMQRYHGRIRQIVVAVRLLHYIETVERLLFPSNQHLFGSANDEIAAIVIVAFTHFT